MGFDILIITLIFVLADLLSGFSAAVCLKNVSSDKLRLGLWHKSGFIGLIALAYGLEVAARHVDLGFNVPAVAMVCVYIIITEAASIFENLCILNPKITASPLGSIFKNDDGAETAEKLEAENQEDNQ